MFSDHEQYVEWLENSMLKRLAKDFAVGYDRVTRMGETQHTAHHVVICAFCRQRQVHANFFLEPVEEGAVPYRVEFSVDLVPHYRMIDNTYRPKVWLILAGQCADCGHVYFVYMLHKEGNPYIGDRQ